MNNKLVFYDRMAQSRENWMMIRFSRSILMSTDVSSRKALFQSIQAKKQSEKCFGYCCVELSVAFP